MVISPIDQKRKEYTLLLEREKRAEQFLNSCSKEDYEKWGPEYKKLLKELSDLLSEIRHYTRDNILDGWPETIKKDFTSKKKGVHREKHII